MLFAHKKRSEDFEAVALPHLDDLFRTASLLLRDRAGAEDLVQEVYLAAWKSFDRFEPGTNCRAWLFKILFNRLHHHLRKWFNAALPRREAEPFEADSLPAPTPIPAELTDEDMLAALGRVPENFRAVIVMADVQDFSYKEIAETLNIPLGTVMSRLSRARRLLRDELRGVARSFGIRGAERGAGQDEIA